MSLDGSRIVSVGRGEKVWDAANGQALLTVKGRRSPIASVAISPDGSRIISGDNRGELKVWDALSGRPLLTIKGHTRSVQVAMSPDGRRIITGDLVGTLRVWDAASGRNLAHPRRTRLRPQTAWL